MKYFKAFFKIISSLLLVVLVVLIVLALWPEPSPITPNVSTNPIYIQNTTIVDAVEDTLIPNQSVLIEGKRIISITPADESTPPQNVEIIDGAGKYVIPGLWDMHSHIGVKTAPQLYMPLYIAAGVTGIRDMGFIESTVPMQEWKSAIEQQTLLSPRIGAYAQDMAGFNFSEKELELFIASAKQESGLFLKVYSGVQNDMLETIASQTNKYGVTFAGHLPRAVSPIKAAQLGHKSFEHARFFLYNSYPGSEQLRQDYEDAYQGNRDENAGPVMSIARKQEMIDQFSDSIFYQIADTMIAYNTYYVPTHLTRKMDAYAHDEDYRDDERLKYILMAQNKGWQEDADEMAEYAKGEAKTQTQIDFYKKGLELTKKAHDAGVKVLAGTDANDTYVFPGLSLHDELEELVKAGLTPAEALVAATQTPAEYFEATADYGSVTTGKMADLVILSGNPLADINNIRNIDRLVYNGGVYTHDELESFKTYVKDNASGIKGLALTVQLMARMIMGG
ncbi:MAG: amidohydrolase family protein [Balneolaceae bacterium]|nr:amidohydrolase family protein [Balneolaceae bacterium]